MSLVVRTGSLAARHSGVACISPVNTVGLRAPQDSSGRRDEWTSLQAGLEWAANGLPRTCISWVMASEGAPITEPTMTSETGPGDRVSPEGTPR